MRLKVRIIGSGVESDPYRVNLPHYTLVEIDYEAKSAIVDVPLEAHGLSDGALEAETLVPHETGEHYETLHPSLIKSVHKHMDERYQEHKGRFRIELVK